MRQIQTEQRDLINCLVDPMVLNYKLTIKAEEETPPRPERHDSPQQPDKGIPDRDSPPPPPDNN